MKGLAKLGKCQRTSGIFFNGERPRMKYMKNYRLLIFAFLFFIFPLFLINSNAQTRTVDFLRTSGGNSYKKAEVVALEKQIFSIINIKSAENSLPPLIWNEQAAQAARLHSRNMSLLNFFGHRGMDGKRVDDRADSVGLKNWRMVGENIAYNRGYGNPGERVIESWMNSRAHRENLLSKNWRETGVGITVNLSGTYYFTQVFVKNN